MANNCLVTELKGTVNNDNLPKFEVIRMVTSNNDSYKVMYVAFNKATTLVAHGGNFVDSNHQNPSPTKTVAANVNVAVYLENNKKIYIDVCDKYNIIRLQPSIGINFVDLNDLQYCTTLKYLTINYAPAGTVPFQHLTALEQFSSTYRTTDIKGNIELLATSLNLRSLSLDHSVGYSGSIEALKNLANLYEINLSGTYITGDANIFADNTKFAGLSLSNAVLNIHNAYGITNKTAEVKALIEAAHPGITVTI